jgi:transposase-like protein
MTVLILVRAVPVETAEKAEIVAASLAPGAVVLEVARGAAISAGQIYRQP